MEFNYHREIRWSNSVAENIKACKLQECNDDASPFPPVTWPGSEK